MIAGHPPARAVRIALARLRQRLGWAGLAGLALLAGATVLAALACNDRRAALETDARVRAARLTARDTSSSAPPPRVEAGPSLSTLGDVPTLLQRIKIIVVDNQLAWGAADYRLRPAADREPPAMEIRTQFTGPYPQVRRTIVEIADKVPGVVIRQLDFGRASTDVPDVTAKVVFAILLADDVVPAASTGASR